MVWVYLVVCLIAYLIGSISFSLIFSKKMAGFDVRDRGSQNAGATNVLRTVGKGPAILTLLCDALKGVLAVLIAYIASKIWEDVNGLSLMYLAGLFAIIGHTFPVFFEFRGGKGVATALGVLLFLNIKVGLICLIFALIIIAVTRTVSIGSMLSAVLFPILILFIDPEKTFVSVLLSILIAAFVIFNHRENLKRIKEGTEKKLSFKK